MNYIQKSIVKNEKVCLNMNSAIILKLQNFMFYQKKNKNINIS